MNKKPETSNQQPATSNQQPATSNQQPATSNQQPATSNPKYRELVSKLREIFQIDKPDLDFGIYRILNARADEINDYLQNRLYAKVQQALSQGSAAQAQQLQSELAKAEEGAKALGVSPDSVPKVLEIR